MKNALTSTENPERLAAVRRYEIVDTPPESAFDQIAILAADLFEAPMAGIGFVEADRIWFKARHGFEAAQLPREDGLCASAIRGADVYWVNDARNDPRTRSHSLVTGTFGLGSYLAATLRTSDGFSLGTICVMDRQPRDYSSAQSKKLIRLANLVVDQLEARVQTRKVAELERLQRQLGQQLQEANAALSATEERFRDLFDEAPIAYVHEGLDSKFIRANRTAMKVLGITPDQVLGTYGKTFAPDTPDAQRRMREAFEAIGRGADTSGVVLEMRRKDNGAPLWIQWWSRPDPSGTFTRTMFLDITDRVMMEQEQARLQAQNAYLMEEIRSGFNFGAIVGESAGLRKVMQQIRLVAPAETAVLVTGESGTGKELVARAIHDHSPRKNRSLIKVNCSAVPDTLFESEFFGHVKGAFTGALKDKLGRFELADGGTLFLDEIGEVPLAMQAKLLRVLQEQELERVGDTRTRKVSVRIIAATNRDLKREVDAGRFRQDLFYRLSVFPIEVPPLRERREDIAPLVTHFVKQTAQRMNRPLSRVSPAVMSELTAQDWPGNVRELQNAVERAVILSQDGPLHFDLPKVKASISSPPIAAASASAPPFATLSSVLTRDELKRRERESIAAALKQADGKLFGAGGAAELLGMKPTTLASRIKALGLTRKG